MIPKSRDNRLTIFPDKFISKNIIPAFKILPKTVLCIFTDALLANIYVAIDLSTVQSVAARITNEYWIIKVEYESVNFLYCNELVV